MSRQRTTFAKGSLNTRAAAIAATLAVAAATLITATPNAQALPSCRYLAGNADSALELWTNAVGGGDYAYAEAFAETLSETLEKMEAQGC